jgi:hypothetical protein
MVYPDTGMARTPSQRLPRDRYSVLIWAEAASTKAIATTTNPYAMACINAPSGVVAALKQGY